MESVIGLDIGSYSIKVSVFNSPNSGNKHLQISRKEYYNLVVFGSDRKKGNNAKQIIKNNISNSVLRSMSYIDGSQISQNDLNFGVDNFSRIVKSDNKIRFDVQHDNKQLQLMPEQILASLLKLIKNDLEKDSIKNPTFIITIPDFYEKKEKIAIKNSAFIAGMDKIQLRRNSESIIQSYIDRNGKVESSFLGRIVVFFDFGYSSTSIYFFLFSNKQYECIYHKTDRSLGVRCLDKIMMNYFTNLLWEKYMVNINQTPKKFFRLWKAVKKIRKILSSNKIANLRLECFIKDQDFSYEFSRTHYEQINLSVLQKLQTFLINAYSEAQNFLDISKLNEFQKFGGGSRIPFVDFVIQQVFKRVIVRKNFDATEILARGASKPISNILQKSYCSYFIDIIDIGSGLWNTELIFKKSSTLNTKKLIFLKDGKRIKLKIYSHNNHQIKTLFEIELNFKSPTELCFYLDWEEILRIENLTQFFKSIDLIDFKDYFAVDQNKLVKMKELEHELSMRENEKEAFQKILNDFETKLYETRNQVQNEYKILFQSEKNLILDKLKTLDHWFQNINRAHITEVEIRTRLSQLKQIILIYDERKEKMKVFLEFIGDVDKYMNFIRNFDLNNSEIMMEGNDEDLSMITKKKIKALNKLKNLRALNMNFSINSLDATDIKKDTEEILQNIQYLQNSIASLRERSFISEK